MNQKNNSDKKVDDPNTTTANSKSTDYLETPDNQDGLYAEANPKNDTLQKQTFSEKWENHRFLFVRATYTLFNTIWIVVMAVGGFIAWLIAMIAL